MDYNWHAQTEYLADPPIVRTDRWLSEHLPTEVVERRLLSHEPSALREFELVDLELQ